MAYHPGLFFADIRLRELISYETLDEFVTASIELIPVGFVFEADPLPVLAVIVAGMVEQALDNGSVNEEVIHAARLLTNYHSRYRYLLEAAALQ